MGSNRIIAFDLLKLLAIFLVVWGHCLQHLLNVPVEENQLFLWITSFHMPLFMALAGMFDERTFSRSWKSYLTNRSRQLLLPWLSWTVIILLIIFLFDGNQSLKYIIQVFINSLWFLKSLFICGLLSLVGFKIHGNRVFWVIVSLIISQIFLIWNVFTMYPCFLFGILCAKHMTYITIHKKSLALITGITFLILSIWAANSPDFWMRGLGIREQLFSGTLSFTQQTYFLLSVIVKRYCQILLGCLGTIFFISFFKLVFDHPLKNYFSELSLLGQYTLGVYVIQTIIVETVLPYLFSISPEYKLIFSFIPAPVIALLAVSISLYINMLIQNGGIYQQYCLDLNSPTKNRKIK